MVFDDYGSVRCSNDVVSVAPGGDQFRKRLASEDEDDASESFYQPRRTFLRFSRARLKEKKKAWPRKKDARLKPTTAPVRDEQSTNKTTKQSRTKKEISC